MLSNKSYEPNLCSEFSNRISASPIKGSSWLYTSSWCWEKKCGWNFILICVHFDWERARLHQKGCLIHGKISRGRDLNTAKGFRALLHRCLLPQFHDHFKIDKSKFCLFNFWLTMLLLADVNWSFPLDYWSHIWSLQVAFVQLWPYLAAYPLSILTLDAL